MNNIHVKKMAIAFGLTGALLYLGCIVLMATVGSNATINFFNNLFHGIDVSSIIRTKMPLWEAAFGIVQTFLLSWLTGACIAGIYNKLQPKQSKSIY